MSSPILTPQASQGSAAANTVTSVSRLVANLQSALNNGIPARDTQGGMPAQVAVSAADLAAALGGATVTKINAVIAAWNA